VLFGCEPEGEIRRKAFPVALDLLIENLHRHAIELGNVGVEDDPLMAEKQDV
jgi:hypothetical protein